MHWNVPIIELLRIRIYHRIEPSWAAASDAASSVPLEEPSPRYGGGGGEGGGSVGLSSGML